jgi:hypothetical protein
MTQVELAQTSGRAQARGEMADAGTPFIHNAWYVIAEGCEVTRTWRARSNYCRTSEIARSG